MKRIKIQLTVLRNGSFFEDCTMAIRLRLQTGPSFHQHFSSNCTLVHDTEQVQTWASETQLCTARFVTVRPGTVHVPWLTRLEHKRSMPLLPSRLLVSNSQYRSLTCASRLGSRTAHGSYFETSAHFLTTEEKSSLQSLGRSTRSTLKTEALNPKTLDRKPSAQQL